MHPKINLRSVAIAGSTVSFFWLLSLTTFKANEFKDIKFNQETKEYEQTVEVKTHGSFPRLIALAALLGFGAIACKANDVEEGAEEEISEAKPTISLKKSKTTISLTEALPTPALYEEADDVEIPVTEISTPTYSPEPVSTSVVHPDRSLTGNLLKSLYGFHKKHLICVAETGAGKTSLLLGLQKMAYEETNGSVDMYICTVKRGAFLGIEDEFDDKGNARRIFVDQMSGKGVAQTLKALNYCLSKMDARGEAREAATKAGSPRPVYPPIIVVLDEMNTLVEAAKTVGKKDDLLKAVNSIANTGREDNVRVWMFGQDYQVQNLGINSGYRDNFGFAILGRIYDDSDTNQEVFACEKMESAFIGKYPLVSNGKDYWEDSLALARENKGIPVIWTSLSRKTCLMPYMPDIEYERCWFPPVKEVPEEQLSESVTEAIALAML